MKIKKAQKNIKIYLFNMYTICKIKKIKKQIDLLS